MSQMQYSIKCIRRQNQELVDKARGCTFNDAILVTEMFIRMTTVNKMLIQKVEKLEEEIATLKGEAKITEN